jgi:hypothetical protein
MKAISLTVGLCFLALLIGPAAAGPSWSWSQWTMGIMTPVNPSATMASQVFGSLPAAGQLGEIAVSQAIIRQGESVPMPVYADGSQAQPNEMFWTAELWQAQFLSMPCSLNPYLVDGDRCDIAFTGTQLTTASVVVSNYLGCVSEHLGWYAFDVQVLVNVVALRHFGPIATKRTSFGELKSRYKVNANEK